MNKQRQRPPKELAVSEQATVPAKIGQGDGQTRVAHPRLRRDRYIVFHVCAHQQGELNCTRVPHRP
ncbi:MAG: hypothetical protein MUP80_08295, partial [Acidobacteriia bacterium]|nr:hypothetical protein [Terriglobia bacterium]